MRVGLRRVLGLFGGGHHADGAVGVDDYLLVVEGDGFARLSLGRLLLCAGSRVSDSSQSRGAKVGKIEMASN